VLQQLMGKKAARLGSAGALHAH